MALGGGGSKLQNMVQIAPGVGQKTVRTTPWSGAGNGADCALDGAKHGANCTLDGAKSGANEVQLAHVFAPTWCKKWCKQGAICNMFSQLHGAKVGAHEARALHQ